MKALLAQMSWHPIGSSTWMPLLASLWTKSEIWRDSICCWDGSALFWALVCCSTWGPGSLVASEPVTVNWGLSVLNRVTSGCLWYIPPTYFLSHIGSRGLYCIKGHWMVVDDVVVVVSVIDKDCYCFRVHRILYDILHSNSCNWVPSLFSVLCVFANYGTCLTLCRSFNAVQKIGSGYWPLLVRKAKSLTW